MRINALLYGRQVQIVDFDRSGSTCYVYYIDGAGNGPLVSTVISTSAFGTPEIVLSTSAFYLS